MISAVPTAKTAGFTVKSGWAAAVLLADVSPSPRVIDSCRIELSDPDIPESRQPYHASFGTARDTGPELSRLLESVQAFGLQSVGELMGRYKADGHNLAGVGIVAGSLVDPDTIANAHIRIHALEGKLFREVVQQAASRHELPCSIWRERDLYDAAAKALRIPETNIRAAVAALKPSAGPWRAEHKSAAVAAWLAFALC
jgi:hypothetical protein